MSGHLIAFEGLDQSGKQTQAELLRDRLKQDGRKSRLVSFPDYGTSIGEEIARALQGEREYGPDVMQLLYIANRYERKPDLQRWLDGGLILVSDRYLASSIAYGEAFGLDPSWLKDIQKYLPPPSPIAEPPILWGSEPYVERLFEGSGIELAFERDTAPAPEFDSGDDAIEYMSTKFGPMIMARQLAESSGRWPELRGEIAALYDGREPLEYLVTVGRKEER